MCIKEKDFVYHIYNRGINKGQIFFKDDNYLFFLQKIRNHLYPFCNILAYCLMPNHFHLLIHANEKSIKLKKFGNKTANIFSENLRILLSSYTRAINKQENRTGSLFQQNTHIKPLNDIFYGKISDTNSLSYAYYCFHYIHNNPVEAGLVIKKNDWIYSSYRDYIGVRNGTIVNKEMALKIIDLEEKYYKANGFNWDLK
ncbi:MAG: transposase [Salinivirgaceae bacterium]|nr:transposase [Salinivirgaceae bacterium]